MHPEFVVKAIGELLCNNCIVEHDFPPYCVNPLTLAEGKKLRLVIDLRHVNAFVSKILDLYPRSWKRIIGFLPGILSQVIIMSTSLQITKSI